MKKLLIIILLSMILLQPVLAIRTTWYEATCSLSDNTWNCGNTYYASCNSAYCKSIGDYCDTTCTARSQATSSSANCVLNPVGGMIGTCFCDVDKYCTGTSGSCTITTNRCDYTCSGSYIDCDNVDTTGCECGPNPSNHCSNTNGNAVGGVGTMPTDGGSADATHKYWHYSCGTACSSTSCAESCTQTDCSGTCVKCPTSGTTCSYQTGSEDLYGQCGAINCQTPTAYYYTFSGRTCYYRANAADSDCDNAGACDTAATVCPSQGSGNSAGTCGICTTNTGCSGTTGYSCPSQGSSTDTYSECSGLDCDGGATKYYYGWVSSTCYYMLDISAALHVCDGSGACKIASAQCPSSTQGSSTGTTCTVCQTQTECSGTTAGTCPNKAANNYTSCTGTTGCSSDSIGEQVCACNGSGTCSDLCGNNVCDSWESTSTCSYDCDRTPPTYSLNSTNSTLAGTPILFNLKWTDNVGLSKAITSLWNGSAWVNATSWCSLSGTTTWCNQTFIVNSTPQTLWWKQYANDTSAYKNWNTSENFSLVTTSLTYSLNSTNSTTAGTPILHSLNWSDDIGLSGYIFSFDNCTGSLTNDTWASFGVSTWSNVTEVVNSTENCTITWCFYANDTSNNWNSSCSSPFSYTTTTPPVFISISISPALMNGIMFGTINPGTNDNPAINNTNGAGGGTAYNITIDSSTTVNVDLYNDASGNLVSGSYIIGIGNVTHQANTTSNTGDNLVAAGSIALSITYSIIGSICQNLLANSNCWISYWLDSPTVQPPGSYTTTYKYCAVQNGTDYGQCG